MFYVWLPVAIITLDYNYASLCSIGEWSVVFYIHVGGRRKESSRSLSHLLMSFLYITATDNTDLFRQNAACHLTNL